MESDPIGLAGGTDPYIYVNGNSFNGTDPLGLCQTCSEAQKEASDLAGSLEHVSNVSGLISIGSSLGAALAGAGEGLIVGLDTPVTISFGASTTFFGSASLITGSSAAALNSFASGNFKSIRNFDFSKLTEVAVHAAASKVPGVSSFAETIAKLSAKATDVALKAKEACR